MTRVTQLITALQNPAAYPHRPEAVAFLQTHISLLFFAGDRVYKVKKPVDMGFLDYTTIENRKHFCEEEVRLNRRLSPEVYLGVVRIVRDPGGAIRVVRDETEYNDNGETIDYAVEMVRLPEERMLPKLIDREEVGEQEMRAIAELLADFHANCPTGTEINQYATVKSLQQQAADNFKQLRGLAEDSGTLCDELIDHVRAWCERFLGDHHDLIERRIEQGRVREGHGDLHAGNICLLDGSGESRIVIYDCIEFTPKFRCRDVAGELGFLAMDMDYRGHGDLGRTLIEHYVKCANDPEMLDLLDYFKVHFAVVRSKVAAIKAGEEDVGPNEQREAAAQARRYLHLAVGYTVTPALILMCGLPATGKSTVAHALVRPLGATVLRTDVIRKQLVGLSPTDRGDESLYRSDISERTYAELADRVRDSLHADNTVIADATFISVRRREQFIRIAHEMNAPFVLVWTTADEATIRERMTARAADNREVSDADWAVYQKMRDQFQPPDEVGEDHCVTVTDRVDVEEGVELVLLKLVRQVYRSPATR